MADWFDEQIDADPPPDPEPAPTPAPAPTTPTAPGNSWDGLTGAALARNPDYMRSEINRGFQERYGRNATDEEMKYWVDKASNPDEFSDGYTRVGWNPYWYDRLANPASDAASGVNAGMDTVVGRNGGGYSLPSIAGAYQLPPGFQMGMYTGGGKYPLSSVMAPGLLAGFTAPFQDPGRFQSPGDFSRPTIEEMKADPGYQSRLREGNQQIQRAAAAKGTLRNPGTIKDLMQWGQDYAANEYGKTYDRAFNENNTAYNRAFNENNTDYNRAWNEYMGAYNIFDRNQANQYNRLSGYAGMGQNAAGSMANYNAGMANRVGNAYTGMGNAQAGVTAGNQNRNNQLTTGIATDAADVITNAFLN